MPIACGGDTQFVAFEETCQQVTDLAVIINDQDMRQRANVVILHHKKGGNIRCFNP